QGDLAGALASYREKVAIVDRLTKLDPGNARWRRDLAVSHAKIADALMKQGDRAGAREALQAGRAILAPLVERHPDWAQWKRDLAWFDARLAELDEPGR
ncbi:MAG: autotransporter strand-loop-strand O-heptosyltransferase, partial [Hyphomicrobiales bacterium]|nr:autotransporter strand-loop-strand O-heptosyltransferase [Hyphomicrobiales bacterium]